MFKVADVTLTLIAFAPFFCKSNVSTVQSHTRSLILISMRLPISPSLLRGHAIVCLLSVSVRPSVTFMYRDAS